MALLEVRNLSRHFGGLAAVDGLTFEVGEGEIRGLIGPNGAGKTTTFNVISGYYRPTGGEVIYRSEVIVFRNGEARLPVELEMRFEDGFVLRESWDGEERWKRFVVERNSPLIAAVVDPDEIHLLDLNRNNNSWKSDSNWKTVAKLSTIGMFWMQNLLHLVAALS